MWRTPGHAKNLEINSQGIIGKAIDKTNSPASLFQSSGFVLSRPRFGFGNGGN